VILVDANLLVYAHVASFDQHEQARTWLDEQLNGSTAVGLPWPSLLAFLRLVSNPRVFERPEPTARAWAQVKAWLDCEPTWIPLPGERHATLLGEVLAIPGIHANLIPDADLAALAIEHGLTICSTDTDFARFPNVRWINPLTP
jgi:toxin-antitoxin system PIN domain toxin